MIKDYVTQAKEISPFKQSLLDDYNSETPSGNVYLNDLGEPKINLDKTGIIPTDGIATVAICRMSQAQKEWFEAVSPHAKILGEASTQYIRDINDIVWMASGKATYHNLYKQASVIDTEGATVTPPLLHCVIAS